MRALSNISYITEEIPTTKSDKDNQTRPELPASQDGITCEYDGSYLIINFEKGEGMASMVLSCVSDGCELCSVNFQASSQFVYYIGEITEPIKVEITTDTGSYYCEIIQ
ncbi:MAG: hypothetical protein K2G41_05745 [Duncaniella sp.]|uniref:hypothetical protein n=1 Tax=Duncaniella sp. TaxID=2518496 RepID=UPI0023C40974|nr:hypothetical protein [Duncaniella sp.]MDE6090186.1 hypothetical protein [Duncaniella sp.]